MPDRRADLPEATRAPSTGAGHDALVDFLVRRLTDELGALWAREGTRTGTARPGLAAQVAVLDDVLTTLAAGGLPCDRELRMLLVGYAHHPDYDPAWAVLAAGQAPHVQG